MNKNDNLNGVSIICGFPIKYEVILEMALCRKMNIKPFDKEAKRFKIGDVANLCDNDLLSISQCGAITLRKIKEALEKNGIAFNRNDTIRKNAISNSELSRYLTSRRKCHGCLFVDVCTMMKDKMSTTICKYKYNKDKV